MIRPFFMIAATLCAASAFAQETPPVNDAAPPDANTGEAILCSSVLQKSEKGQLLSDEEINLLSICDFEVPGCAGGRLCTTYVPKESLPDGDGMGSEWMTLFPNVGILG